MDNDKIQMKSEVSYISQIYVLLTPSIYCDMIHVNQKKKLRVTLYLRETDVYQFPTPINNGSEIHNKIKLPDHIMYVLVHCLLMCLCSYKWIVIL